MSVEIETIYRRRAQSRSMVLAALRFIAAELHLFMRQRATHKALSGLTDYELQDIGLVRTQMGYRKLQHDRLGAHYWD